MFTGLIETTGRVNAINATVTGANISISAPLIAHALKIGDSVSTNGVCLTVTTKLADGFTADVMPVTLSNTNLGSLKRGSLVNLERAMTMASRLDGHMVTGHVDAKGVVTAIRPEGIATIYRIELPKDVVGRMIDRGSIAIDGISLTIQTLLENGVEVSIIPHTSDQTTLSEIAVGSDVNVESDVIGKYVERLLGLNKQTSNVNMDLLAKCGFL